ncbi:MAG: hypothetical protein CML02_07850 [Pseudooceanicola sp.]|jgi:uncharacterized protein (DUF1800 family)|nr:hypothetical protein [Pseudooceanicola sp.]
MTATFSPDLAEIRFGCGLSPTVAAPGSPAEMIAGLRTPDDMAARFPIDSAPEWQDWLLRARGYQKQVRQNRNDLGLVEEFNAAKADMRVTALRWAARSLLRWTHSPNGFRERLVAFWADHFTAIGKNGVFRAGTAPYIEDAIRPNIAGSFGDMLVAVVTHPLMLHYLDQDRSAGPNSRAAERARRTDGLNENLAREVLELHTLGVNGPYTQTDVRELAELFTGLGYTYEDGFVFRKPYAEPGAEIVLGQSYGGKAPRLDDITAALHDIARHPATAQHIAQKLAVHFVSDTPDAGLVQALARRYGETGGDLTAVYDALLAHPASWVSERVNVKPPADFIASAWRALAVSPEAIENLSLRDLRRTLILPLRDMGQPWQAPDGPDGWPEEDSAWLTPQGVSARLRWAVSAPPVLCDPLPEPGAFAPVALGQGAVPEAVQFATRAAETPADAIGLVLAAPAFQRR